MSQNINTEEINLTKAHIPLLCLSPPPPPARNSFAFLEFPSNDFYFSINSLTERQSPPRPRSPPGAAGTGRGRGRRLPPPRPEALGSAPLRCPKPQKWGRSRPEEGADPAGDPTPYSALQAPAPPAVLVLRVRRRIGLGANSPNPGQLWVCSSTCSPSAPDPNTPCRVCWLPLLHPRRTVWVY